MYCIFCGHTSTDVIETRLSEDGSAIRRRRNCPKCQRRFTTYERIEELPILVIKRDNTRERFEREKLRRGLLKAAEKTTVSADHIEKISSEIESELKQQSSTEVESNLIGNLVAKKLKKLDKVAYIRFASVFKRFVDVEEFEKELKKLL
ncbi:MAG: transcriptional regulator NrdR [Candidatus Roizmanbacteria bacterium]|nr:MAG: transcriptional regulator NrdR [Candidatus Roizmanbacteria bacterium]